MIDFLSSHPIYVVLIAAVMIWLGLAWYLTRVDRKVAELERRLGR
jgi:CcmD family protein